MRTKRLVPLVLLFLAAMLGTYACSSNSSEGFAIYLTKDNIPPARMDALSYVRLSFQPLITAEDLLAYDPSDHRMELGAEALNRISALEVPTTGKSFLVCVDKVPIYWGAFWTPVSSQSFAGVTIILPLPRSGERIIQLSLGYPTEAFFRGEDPRNDQKILDALNKAGKLIAIP